ncbi:MAG: hypothetical protein IPM25_06755 [Chloracidobacterium sp.]|nr:hypothetical protein [Chloracidobacterium sp.]
MKLHSDFHDYYDHAIGYGIDEKVHYNRYAKPVEITLKTEFDRPLHPRSGFLGFCGNLFPFVQLSRYDKKRDYDWEDEYDGRIVEDFSAFSLDEYKEKEEAWDEYSDDIGFSSDIRLKQFFGDWRMHSDALFVELQCPVWMMLFYQESPNGVLNPRLKNLGFERIRDAFTAFQEISMYVANILIEQKEIGIVDDKHRIEQHGFDFKQSFRHRK